MYIFTNDWFEFNRKDWEEFLPALASKKINAIEIGSYEGRSTVWLLENVLLNKKSHITCIDTFEGSVEHVSKGADMKSVEDKFDLNIKASGKRDRVTKIKGKSQEILRTFPLDSADFIYVDGSHEAKDIMEDAILGWRLLRKDGIMIFDDYPWKLTPESTHNPKIAIDGFLYLFQGEYKIIFIKYSVMIQKL